MKVRFLVDRTKLAQAMDMTSKSLSAAPTESILKNFCIDAEKGGLWVSATDKVVMSSVWVKAQVSDQGRLLVPAAKGLELIKKAHGQVLAMGLTDSDDLSVVCGHSKWNLRTRSAETYPDVSLDAYHAEVHEVGAYELFSAIHSVYKAMALNLTGFAQVSIKDGKVRAADGVWFQEAILPNSGKNLDISIPYVVVPNVLAFLSRSNGIMEVSITEMGQVVFQRDEDSLLSFRLPNQKAPDLSKAFAAPLMTNQDKLKVDRAALRAAIGRVAIAADSATLAISLSLSVATVDSVVVSARASDGSYADEPVSCSWVGDSRRVILHKDYILNALNSFVTDDVTFHLGPDSPSNPSQVMIKGGGCTAVLNQLRADLL